MLRKQATGTAFHLELPHSLEPVRGGGNCLQNETIVVLL